jgi:phosphoglycolate phosphatase-like HAD superfamily hydrolase
VTANRLVLWDIDHTLIETGGVGGEVFRTAFEHVTGKAIEELADVTGRTEQVIFADTLKLHGLTDPGDYFPKFTQALADEYRARFEADPSGDDLRRYLGDWSPHGPHREYRRPDLTPSSQVSDAHRWSFGHQGRAQWWRR